MFVYPAPECLVTQKHPLRPVRVMVGKALAEQDIEFEVMYSHVGRPLIPAEHLLKALLLQALYTIRSNRLLVEQIDSTVLFRWFLGLSLYEEVWDHSSFSASNDRLIKSDVARIFLVKMIEQMHNESSHPLSTSALTEQLSKRGLPSRAFSPKTSHRRHPESVTEKWAFTAKSSTTIPENFTEVKCAP